MKQFSFEKASKFKNEDKFFDINYLWVPGLRWTVEKLYYTPTRPEAIVLLSLISGIISAYFFAQGEYLFSIAGVFFLQLKNFLDTVDGYLARAKDMTSRIGRFLDSLADAFVYICLFTGIAINIASDGNRIESYLISYLAMLSAFLQCSVYNYYLVSYKTMLNGKGINRTDESFCDNDKPLYKDGLSGMVLFVLQMVYQFVYSWQDKIVAKVDKIIFIKAAEKKAGVPIEKFEQDWYADKTFLSLVSPLCFGTQILILSLFALWSNIAGFLYFLIIVCNLYTLFVFILKINFLAPAKVKL